MVMQKLRPWAPPLTETLDSRFLERVMGTLFPVGRGNPITPYTLPCPEQQGEIPGVTEEEVAGAIKKVKSKKAPGPDGIPGRILTLASGFLGERLALLFTRALRERRFPPVWGRANVVLLRKESKPEDSPSAYRPICLLDEAGKLFERVIAARLRRHMSQEGPDLDGGQYGFREGRSTVDAIRHLKSLSGAIVAEGRVAVAVSLDRMPWGRLVEAMRNHFRFPPYLTATIEDYFRGRRLTLTDADGAPSPLGCSVLCYADDTLVLAGGNDWGDAIHVANQAVAGVVRAIRNLGLVVAEKKTEAIFFHARKGKPPRAHVRVGAVRVPLEAQMNYLGLKLDGTWCFREHINRLVPGDDICRAWQTYAQCRGTGQEGSSLPRGIPQLCGAVWSASMGGSVGRQSPDASANAQSAEGAGCQGSQTERKRELLRTGGVDVSLAGAIRAMKHQTRQVLLQRWQRFLANARYGRRTIEAVWPFLHEWVGRAHGTLTFRMAQDCPTWSIERRVMVNDIGNDLPLFSIIGAVLESEKKWEAFSSFCETVISQKEEAEEGRKKAEDFKKNSARGEDKVVKAERKKKIQQKLKSKLSLTIDIVKQRAEAETVADIIGVNKDLINRLVNIFLPIGYFSEEAQKASNKIFKNLMPNTTECNRDKLLMKILCSIS
ncbi:uncharacterized protein LOC112590177 [Harpegnathos saltator]|uniref:uncharacterized protein LOC112590177 n=1 Tax=Harpegnathos saltator TaxID=610380 RepID=UPI000DBEEA69|nr:uncharacterized protein LOC112590177 [Harpegnathos saltator]